MKIIELINLAEDDNRRFFSFEYFPPKTDSGVVNLIKRVESMSHLGPLFVDVTWSPKTKLLTPEICADIIKLVGVEVMMHITCSQMTKEELRTALHFAKKSGIRNIMALRGDGPPPESSNPNASSSATSAGSSSSTGAGVGSSSSSSSGNTKSPRLMAHTSSALLSLSSSIPTEFQHAIDIVKFIRAEFGDYFGIAVGAYPEALDGSGCDSQSYKDDIKYLKEKIDAGADFIVTQLFFDPDVYVRFVNDCRAAGITCPILPGIMPIQNYKPFKRTVDCLRTRVPDDLMRELEPMKFDDAKVKDYGIKYAVKLCERLIGQGAPGVHFFTLNLEQSVQAIVGKLSDGGYVQGWFPDAAELALIKSSTSNGRKRDGNELADNLAQESAKCATVSSSAAVGALLPNGRQLPWRRIAYHPTRQNEFVRPIYWANRPKSYVHRTDGWDEYPNGRWGDKSSPAFGEYNDFHYYRKVYGSEDNRRILWGERPQSFKEIYEVFAGYIEGKVSAIPWTEYGLALETGYIKDSLIKLNMDGFMTINSQPRVNGVRSDDKVFGWGPSGGYVYQKAYLEFFTSRRLFAAIQSAIEVNPNLYSSLQYHAVNHDGSLRWETPGLPSKTCAVTWGVFPGREIQQPTVADSDTAMVWKDEAFSLWVDVWATLYPEDSISSEILWKIHNEYVLVNIVDNDYIEGDIFKVFNDPIVQQAVESVRKEEKAWELKTIEDFS